MTRIAGIWANVVCHGRLAKGKEGEDVSAHNVGHVQVWFGAPPARMGLSATRVGPSGARVGFNSSKQPQR